MCGGQRTTSGICLYPLPLFGTDSLFLFTSWLARAFPESLCSTSQLTVAVLGLQTCSVVYNFYMGSGDWNPNPWACVPNPLPTPAGPFQSLAASLAFPFFESIIFSLILSCVFQPGFLSPVPCFLICLCFLIPAASSFLFKKSFSCQLRMDSNSQFSCLSLPD